MLVNLHELFNSDFDERITVRFFKIFSYLRRFTISQTLMVKTPRTALKLLQQVKVRKFLKFGNNMMIA